MDLVKRLKSICLDTVAADTLNAIFQNWAALNPQLTTILNWTSHAPHPCNISNTFNFETLGLKYEGAWSGVGCAAVLTVLNATGSYYSVSVASLQ
jgi:hypothetical protein